MVDATIIYEYIAEVALFSKVALHAHPSLMGIELRPCAVHGAARQKMSNSVLDNLHS